MISEKIRKQISDLEESKELKQLMLYILEAEDKGVHRYKDTYDSLVNEYLVKVKGNEYDD